ncbi:MULTISPECIES: aldo/keto reductase [unclassified Leifsonia]|uniref:aldo/keto reductase n=1 Tax=unclassified Leifsonia TaxID=2663824 RepID=UPI0008A7B710|nr:MULTISPECIES: aldo/keto reductase [unclassified Leifsonia]SEI16758.1 D-threo-aldose 1-dehydrogenase [Leifsonia sp. CL154]SFM07958.1 D-threo-aldose 1-dehydrogenase [Leifsonia sp. CL147]
MPESVLPRPRRAPALAFGPLSFGGGNLGNLFRAMSDDDAHAMLEFAWEAGIRSFDTAPHYGLGLSERRLGAFLATKPRDEFVLSTKVGRLLVDNPGGSAGYDDENGFAVPDDLRRVWDFSADGVRRSLEDSLLRLGLDRVDVLYLHDPDEFDLDSAIADGVPAVAALRDDGLVRAVGIGSKSVTALLAGVRTDALDLLMIAGRYTLLEQPALEEVIPEAAGRGIGVVNAAVFNSGLLARSTPGPSARYEYAAAPSAVLERARAIAAVCAEHDVELPAAALQYTLRDPAVRTVVAGAASAAQLRQTVERMGASIPEALWADLRDRDLIP